MKNSLTGHLLGGHRPAQITIHTPTHRARSGILEKGFLMNAQTAPTARWVSACTEQMVNTLFLSLVLLKTVWLGQVTWSLLSCHTSQLFICTVNRTEVSRIRSVNNWISVCSLLIRSPFWIIFNLFPHVFLLSQRCKVCPLTFLTKSEMQIHSKSHTEAKPHKCPHCSKTFANASYLSQHLRIHLGIKPYHCSYCENSFRQLSHLQQHTRWVQAPAGSRKLMRFSSFSRSFWKYSLCKQLRIDAVSNRGNYRDCKLNLEHCKLLI